MQKVTIAPRLVCVFICAATVCVFSACAGDAQIFGGDNTILGRLTSKPAPSSDSIDHSLVLPHIIARTRLPNDYSLAVSLQMTDGLLITGENHGYIPDGFMDNIVFENNYVGNYELVCEKDGKAVSSIIVSFSGSDAQNYTSDERFEFNYADYSHNGSTQFLLGCGGIPSGNRIYNLYNVDSSGNISLVLEDIKHSSMEFSPLLELSDTGFYANYFNPATGLHEQTEHTPG